MTLESLKVWIRQPSTIDGIGTVLGLLAGAAAHFVAHDVPVTLLVAGTAKSLVSLGVNDNTAAGASVQKLVSDSIQAIATKRLAAQMPLLVGDVMAVATATGIAAPAVAPPPAP